MVDRGHRLAPSAVAVAEEQRGAERSREAQRGAAWSSVEHRGAAWSSVKQRGAERSGGKVRARHERRRREGEDGSEVDGRAGLCEERVLLQGGRATRRRCAKSLRGLWVQQAQDELARRARHLVERLGL